MQISDRLRAAIRRATSPARSIDDLIRAAEDAIRRGDIDAAEAALDAARRAIR